METQIEKLCRILEVTEEEAKQIIEEDKAIDRMTMKEVVSDLSEEQRKTIKNMSKVERKPTVYKFNKREVKANNTKIDIIAQLYDFLTQYGVENAEIVNKERQIAFNFNENDYELTLVQKRKAKK